MISSISCMISGADQTLKFSTRAQARVERELDASIDLILASIGSRYGIDAVSRVLAASWDNGKGCNVEAIYDVVDEIGGEEAGQIVGKLIKAAFPPIEGDEKAGSAKK